ncbi:hypothetical protein GF336_00350 [Candidatus Woesearchaeota archaeon]|nr:hypothetical protein [Candidatus Woesearchaeota archaeon]
MEEGFLEEEQEYSDVTRIEGCLEEVEEVLVERGEDIMEEGGDITGITKNDKKRNE